MNSGLCLVSRPSLRNTRPISYTRSIPPTISLFKYNSREIDFGNELDYSELLETIKEADSRIKSVSLNIPTYEPILNCVESNEIVNKPLYSNDNINENNKTVAKMVLSGKVQLFKFKDDFQIDFGQSQASSTDTLSNIKTYNSIDIECVTSKDDTLNTILNQNDIIQIIYPSLITTDTYNPTVKYMSNFSCDSGLHVLVGDEKLRFIYNNWILVILAIVVLLIIF